MLAGCVEHGFADVNIICCGLVFVQVNVCGQAAAMGEQMPNCDAIFVFSGEGGYIKLHGCVEVEATFIDK